MMEFTGERFVPGITESSITYEHMHRYALAANFVTGKHVLDLASGEGYGAAFLSERAASVIGLDLDPKAVKHAHRHYLRPNLRFQESTITNIPLPDQSKDIITCFEAIEHIGSEQQHAMLAEIRRVLVPGGLVLISTPDKLTYTDAPNYHNPFHVHELYHDEFVSLLKKYLPHVSIFGQRVYSGSFIWSLRNARQDHHIPFALEQGSKGLQYAPLTHRRPIYFVAIASNKPLTIPESLASSLVDLSDTKTVQLQDQIQVSRTKNQELLEQLNRITIDLRKLKDLYEFTRQQANDHAQHLGRDIKNLQHELRGVLRERDDHRRVLADLLNSRLVRAAILLRSGFKRIRG